MSPREVAFAIGVPTQASKNSNGDLVELREADMISCTYILPQKKLVEVGFSRIGGIAIFDSIDLNAEPAKRVLTELIRRDPNAVRGFDTFVFPALGLSLTGYYPELLDTKAATAFAPGQWDELIPLMKERLPKLG